MRPTVASVALSFTLFCSGVAGAESEGSIVFGQIQLAGNNAIAASWKLVVRNVDTRENRTIALEPRETTSVLYDFAAPLPPGKYHLHLLEAPSINGEFRITKADQFFELKPGAALYLGNWTIQPGGKTTQYSVKYDIDEVSLFAKANPGIDASRFAIGVLGKPPVQLKAQ